jgi:hypothetical protein
LLAAIKLAGHAELIAEKLLGDGTMASVHVDGTDWSGRTVVGDCEANTANQVGKGSDGAQDWVAGAALGPGVHTNVTLLVLPGNCDVLGSMKVFGGMWDLTFVLQRNVQRESKRTIGTPFAVPNVGEKGSGDELAVGWGLGKQEEVGAVSGPGKEACPSSPASVDDFKCSFLFTVSDDAVSCRTRQIQEEMFSGSGEIVKDSGI